jgi:hypothetical protein
MKQRIALINHQRYFAIDLFLKIYDIFASSHAEKEQILSFKMVADAEVAAYFSH